MKEGWEIKKLGDVCVFKSGTTISTSLEREIGDVLYVKVGDMNLPENEIEINTSSRFVNSNEIKAIQIIPEGAVIFPKRGGAIATNKKRKVIRPTIVDLNTMAIIPANKLDNEYFYYWFQMIDLDDISNGTTIPQINNYSFDNVHITYPNSLPEQQRIVSILDEAFAAIAKAKANAEQNLKNGKELFESYLQGVFENGNWEKKDLREITTILGDGLHGTPKYSTDGDYYFINGNNLNDGKIELKENTKRVNVDEFDKYKKKLTNRTVLVSINGTLGNVAFYNDEKIILGKSACYFNLKEIVDKYFVKYVLSSPYFINYAHREATGATIKNVSLKTMREFKVPLPTIHEQQTIVRKLDALRAETQKLEAIYQKKL